MAFTITINGTDRTDKVTFRTFRKKDNLNQQVDSCRFDINKKGADTYVPTIGHEVVVTRDGTKIFAGVILRIDETVEASTILTFKVQCVDYSQYLKRKLVTERYTDTTVGTIIADIIANYTEASDSITGTNVAGSLSVKSFSFDRLTVGKRCPDHTVAT